MRVQKKYPALVELIKTKLSECVFVFVHKW